MRAWAWLDPSCNPSRASTPFPPVSLCRWEMKEMLTEFKWNRCTYTGHSVYDMFFPFPAPEEKRSGFPNSDSPLTHKPCVLTTSSRTEYFPSFFHESCLPYLMQVCSWPQILSPSNTPNFTPILPYCHGLFWGLSFKYRKGHLSMIKIWIFGRAGWEEFFKPITINSLVEPSCVIQTTQNCCPNILSLRYSCLQ